MTEVRDGNGELVPRVTNYRKWTSKDKSKILAEAAQPGISYAYVARKYGITVGQINQWKKWQQNVELIGMDTNLRTVKARELLRLKMHIEELEKELGRKTLEADILKSAVKIANEKKLISPATWQKLQDLGFV